MNFSTYKFTEGNNNYYFYAISHIDNLDIVSEQVEHTIANELEKPMNQYLITVAFDKVTIEKSSISTLDVINRKFQQDSKCMNISTDYVSLIPPPKQPKVKQSKPKAEKPIKEPKQSKVPKPRGKQSVQRDNVTTEPTTLIMNN